MGAIQSGNTTCGLFIGSGAAIGFQCGRGKEGVPEEHPEDRQRAIKAVEELYKDFLKEFGTTDCKTLCRCDFSDAAGLKQWIKDKGWKSTCDVYLRFVMTKCVEMAEEGKI